MDLLQQPSARVGELKMHNTPVRTVGYLTHKSQTLQHV